MKKFYYLILLISGCVSNQDAHPPIFSFSKQDLNNLIENSEGISFEKTVIFNQKTETKKVTFTKEKLKKELSFFYELDINNPEFGKTFSKDSISNYRTQKDVLIIKKFSKELKIVDKNKIYNNEFSKRLKIK